MGKRRKNNKSKKSKAFFVKSNKGNSIKSEEAESRNNPIIDFKEKMKNFKFKRGSFLQNKKEYSNKFISAIKTYYKKLVLILKKWNSVFYAGMTCKDNLRRDVIILIFCVFLAASFLGMGQYVSTIKNKMSDRHLEIISNEELIDKFEEENANKIETIQEVLDISQWKNYQSAWYGFKIKYPQNWEAPIVQPYSRLSKAIYRVSFLDADLENKNIIGFDVAVYDITKVSEFFQTDEFPKIKNASLKESAQCENIEGHLLETGDYPAEEIYIPPADNCYDATLFFSVVSGQYIYNITPKFKEGAIVSIDPMVSVSDNLPQFFSAVSSFENVDIVRPKPKQIQPKITAPKPASYKVVNGRMVCEKKNDKPGKSDKGKGKHLDMECCLDPDEYPNPHCYYDTAKYGKYLK